MGRSISDGSKTQYVKIRVRPDLKQTIRAFQIRSKYRGFEENQFLMMLVEVGLEVEQIEAGWHDEAIAMIAKARSAQPSPRQAGGNTE